MYMQIYIRIHVHIMDYRQKLDLVATINSFWGVFKRVPGF